MWMGIRSEMRSEKRKVGEEMRRDEERCEKRAK